ncbi:MAG: tetratricopeptide repeat protein [Planctomycetia bacterium]|nr:tetratricopeptide repeat protein [Planctomycetia bacterium]
MRSALSFARNYFLAVPMLFALLATSAIAEDAPKADEKKPADAPTAPAAKPETKPAKAAEPAANPFPGQADLDAAIAAKVSAESLQDLSKAIELCDRAISLGLDKENKKFAQTLLASSRIERAAKVGHAIFDTQTPDPRWPQFRRLALADLELALAFDADNAEGQLLMARLHALPGGDAKRALTAVEAAIRLSENKPLLKCEALVVRAEMSSDKELRLADYNEAVKLQPDSATALRSRGFFFLLNDKPDAARADLEKAAEIEPDHAGTREALGLVLMIGKNYDAAQKQLDKAVELAPDSPSPHANRARLLALREKNDQAVEEIDKALKLSPDNVGWELLRASILSQAGRKKEALDGVDKLISRKPDLIEAVRIRAHILAASDKLPDAIAELEKAQTAMPGDLELTADLAALYTADKKPRRAIPLYDKVLSGGVKLALVYRGRADAYLSLGQQKEAIADYESALKQNPKDSGVLNNLAWVLATSPDEKLRDGKRSIELAKQACEATDYKAAHILSTLAAAYAEAGDYPTAIKWSKKSLDLADDTVRDSLKKELASYQAGKPTRELQNEETDREKAAPGEKPKSAEKSTQEKGPSDKTPATGGKDSSTSAIQ